MTKPIAYWCPMCGDLPETTNPFPWMPGQAWHHGACDFKAIPVCTPLDVAEPTTWGESGGAEAVCHEVWPEDWKGQAGSVCYVYGDDREPQHQLSSIRRHAHCHGDWKPVEVRWACDITNPNTDASTAINYVVGKT